MEKNWHIATITLKPDDIDIVSDILDEMGSAGVAEDHTKAPEVAILSAYFSTKTHGIEELKKELKEYLALHPSLKNVRTNIETKAVDDWCKKWQQWFKPFAIVPNIIVVPSWEKYTAKQDETVISLDPGMAFGTGLHETTKLCAEMIYESKNLGSIADIGTGSGILAIVANKLGFNKIAVVENDEDALKVAVENLNINKVPNFTQYNSLDKLAGTYDVVVANILLAPLIELKKELVSLVAKNGTLILSGITNEQEGEIIDSYSKHPKLVKVKQMGEWSCAVFKQATSD